MQFAQGVFEQGLDDVVVELRLDEFAGAAGKDVAVGGVPEDSAEAVVVSMASSSVTTASFVYRAQP